MIERLVAPQVAFHYACGQAVEAERGRTDREVWTDTQVRLLTALADGKSFDTSASGMAIGPVLVAAEYLAHRGLLAPTQDGGVRLTNLGHARAAELSHQTPQDRGPAPLEGSRSAGGVTG